MESPLTVIVKFFFWVATYSTYPRSAPVETLLGTTVFVDPTGTLPG